MVVRTRLYVTLYVQCLSCSMLFYGRADRKSRYLLWCLYLVILIFAGKNFMTLEDWVDRLSRNASKELTTLRYVISQKAQISSTSR